MQLTIEHSRMPA
ncbi:unnamed protein product, partial [Allacma fusca]